MTEHALPPRLPRMSADDAAVAAEEAGVATFMASLSVFQMLLAHPTVAKPMYDLLGALLWKGELDRRPRELAIMRLGWLTASVYEWTQHWRVSVDLDIDEASLLATREPDGHESWSVLSALDQAVVRAVDETLADDTISDVTWTTLHDELGDAAALELVVAIGHWRMYASLLRTLRVPLEDGVDPWPPDGRSPTR